MAMRFARTWPCGAFSAALVLLCVLQAPRLTSSLLVAHGLAQQPEPQQLKPPQHSALADPGSLLATQGQAARLSTVEQAAVGLHALEKKLSRRKLEDVASKILPIIKDFCLGYGSAAIVVAILYKVLRSWPEGDPTSAEKDLSKWSSGPFECCDDISTCCCACWCPEIRWAENLSMVGLLNFWAAFALFLLFSLLSGILPFMWVVICAVGVYYRQTLRQRFKMEGQGECSTYMGDCLLYCCCTCCAIAQEARHLEAAARADHPAVREQRPGGPLLAAPVQEEIQAAPPATAVA